MSEYNEHAWDLQHSACVTMRKVDLFGSAVVTGSGEVPGELDFLVEFGSFPNGGYSEHYFGLIEDLTALFDRPIHLFVGRAVRNPYLLRSINQTRKSLFADSEARDTSELAQFPLIAHRELPSEDEQEAVFGLRASPPRGGIVTNELIDELRDKDSYRTVASEDSATT